MYFSDLGRILHPYRDFGGSLWMKAQYSSLKTAHSPSGEASIVSKETYSNLMFNLMNALGKEFCSLGGFC